jgi:hypothetical protein
MRWLWVLMVLSSSLLGCAQGEDCSPNPADGCPDGYQHSIYEVNGEVTAESCRKLCETDGDCSGCALDEGCGQAGEEEGMEREWYCVDDGDGHPICKDLCFDPAGQ